MMLLTLAAFAPLDWLVLGGYLSLLAVSGVVLSLRRQEGAEDYFLARHNIPAWAASASLVATSLSAATFVGVPEFGFKNDLTYLSSYLGTLVAILIVAAFFIPAFYRYRVTTVYGLLEQKLGSGAKSAASATFLVGRVLAEGARLFMAAIAASLILFGDTASPHLLAGIGTLVTIGVFYTFIGGIRSVVFSDVLQLFIFILAAGIAIAVLLSRIPGDWSHLVAMWQSQDKIAVARSGLDATQPLGIDFGSEFTLVSAFTGLILLNIAAYATDHDMAQRILTCRSAVAGSRSAVLAVLLTIPVVGLFLLVGLLLWAFYSQPVDGQWIAQPPEGSREVFISFILTEIPTGLKGLLMAGLFAAALSTVNSAMNAMSAVFVTEFYRKLRPDHSERHYLAAARWSVVGAGLAVGGFACLSVLWMQAGNQGLIKFALGVMTYAYSGLVAVFLAAILTNRGNSLSAIAALLAGFVTVGALEWQPWAEASDRIALAFPYRMMIATCVAFGICCVGRREHAAFSERPLEAVQA